MEILFYSVSFCPPFIRFRFVLRSQSLTHLILLIRLSWLCGRELEMGRRQFHTGEESQGGNFGNKRRATEKRSPIGPY